MKSFEEGQLVSLIYNKNRRFFVRKDNGDETVTVTDGDGYGTCVMAKSDLMAVEKKEKAEEVKEE